MNVLGNCQLAMLPQSAGSKFDPRLVRDNSSVPLWVICVYLCQSIKIKLTNTFRYIGHIYMCPWSSFSEKKDLYLTERTNPLTIPKQWKCRGISISIFTEEYIDLYMLVSQSITITYRVYRHNMCGCVLWQLILTFWICRMINKHIWGITLSSKTGNLIQLCTYSNSSHILEASYELRLIGLFNVGWSSNKLSLYTPWIVSDIFVCSIIVLYIEWAIKSNFAHIWECAFIVGRDCMLFWAKNVHWNIRFFNCHALWYL